MCKTFQVDFKSCCKLRCKVLLSLLWQWQNRLSAIMKTNWLCFCCAEFLILSHELSLAGVFAPTLFSKAYGNLVCDACTNSTGSNSTGNSSGPFICHNCHYDVVGILSNTVLFTVQGLYAFKRVMVFCLFFNRTMAHCSTATWSKKSFLYI